MNQQNQGSGLPSDVPAKRKRGRPRKYENVVHVENMSTGNKTSDDHMVGKVVTGFVEGVFGAGYLLNVRVLDDPDTPLRGLVFEPSQVNPITPENDVAPHLNMIKRKDLPIPVLFNTQTEIHGSVPSSVPVSEEQLPPTEINFGISVSVEKDLPKNETSNIMSKLESDKTDKQGDILHELDASTHVKESTTDGGVRRDSKPSSPTIELDASTKVKESTAVGDGEATRPVIATYSL